MDAAEHGAGSGAGWGHGAWCGCPGCLPAGPGPAACGGQRWGDKYQVAIAGGTPPDIADIEQGTFGRFLRGEVPLIELGPRLKREGFWDKLITSRQSLYTWQGKVYGVEHALTPVVLY